MHIQVSQIPLRPPNQLYLPLESDSSTYPTITSSPQSTSGRGQFPAVSNCNPPPQGPEGVPGLLKIFTLLQHFPGRYYARKREIYGRFWSKMHFREIERFPGDGRFPGEARYITHRLTAPPSPPSPLPPLLSFSLSALQTIVVFGEFEHPFFHLFAIKLRDTHHPIPGRFGKHVICARIEIPSSCFHKDILVPTHLLQTEALSLITNPITEGKAFDMNMVWVFLLITLYGQEICQYM